VSTASPTRSHPLARAARIVAAWTAFGLVMAQSTALDVRMRGTQRGWVSIVGGSMLGAWIWAMCTPFVMAWARRLRPLREHGWRGWLVFLAGHLALAVAVTGVDAVLYHYIRPLIDEVRSSIPRVFAAVLLLDLALYAIVAAIAEALEYARRARELERTLDEVRLHALEAQLRPHFLYNTLNLIAELVHDEPDAADAMLTRLGLLLRRSYGETPHLVPLGQELEIVRAYADILARRYRDRVALQIDVPATLHDQLVPVFSLQPLVENAFRHGVERREGATVVEVSGARRDGDVVLRVTDRGLGAPTPRDARPHSARAGIGLRNTRERLAALFGGAAGVTVEQQGDVATATLSIPARTSAPAALVTDTPSGTAPAVPIAALASRG
jgi:sensor histidine kinase YesM